MAKIILEQQVRTFLSRERASYEKFGELLTDVLRFGAKECTSGSTVSVRVKAPASFAEKCIRKSGKYDDPVYELTDLCGARVVTYTLDEVERLCNFVEHYFVVDRANSEDKLSLLRTGEFAYRSVHYVVQIDPERFRELGLSPQKIRDWEKLINRPQKGKTVPFYRKAEIQLQTYLQHVWAETMHNRTYKTGIRLPQPLLRESYRIAALLEKADEDLRILSGRIDAFAGDYAAHLSPEGLERELNIVKILVGQEGLSPEERGNVSLRLLELLASANRWEEVLSWANKLRSRGKGSKFFNELDRLEASALCRVHRANPSSKKFRSGLSILVRLAHPVTLVRKSNDDSAGHIDEIAEALACSVDGHGGVTRDVPHAAVMAELALAYFYDTTDAAPTEKARETFLQAHLLDPQNPYLFCDYLWLLLQNAPDRGFMHCAWNAVEESMEKIREHLRVGLNRNRALAALGRFHLLRSEWEEAGQAYARLISNATTPEILFAEEAWLEMYARIPGDHFMATHITQLVRALKLARRVQGLSKKPASDKKALIVAGTSAPEKVGVLRPFRHAVIQAVSAFKGIVIAGGTNSGVSHMVGEAFEKGHPQGSLVGFLPGKLFPGVSVHPAYRKVVRGKLPNFGLESVLQYWEYLLDQGIAPEDVRVLGLGGGAISRFEYDFAVALGATVGLVRGSGREADRILTGDFWGPEGSIVELAEEASILMFCLYSPGRVVSEDSLEYQLAAGIHENYLRDPSGEPPNRKPWEVLSPTFRCASFGQAQGMTVLLARVGLEVLPLQGVDLRRVRVHDLGRHLGKNAFTELAKMEHARWCLERARDGWHFGKARDNEKKLHPDFVPWDRLSSEAQEIDFRTLKGWPEVLAHAGFGIFAIRGKTEKQRKRKA